MEQGIIPAQLMPVRERETERLALHLGTAHQLITRKYLEHLAQAELIPMEESALKIPAERNLRLIRLTDMVYDHHENIVQKISSVFSSLSFVRDANVVLFLHNVMGPDGETLEMYMGVSGSRLERLESASAVLRQSISGQFPGCNWTPLSNEDTAEFLDRAMPTEDCAVSSASVDAVLRSEGESGFVQGLEKFADSMRGRPYTLAIIAMPVQRDVIDESIRTYEELYTEISPYQRVTMTQSRNESAGTTTSQSTQFTRTLSRASTVTTGVSTTQSTGTSRSGSSERFDPKGSMIEIGVSMLSSLLLPRAGGAIVGSRLGSMARKAMGYGQEQESTGTQESTAEGKQSSEGETTSEAEAQGDSRTESASTQQSEGMSVQYARENFAVTGLLRAIGEQIDRLGECRGQGAFRIASYVMAGDYDTANAGAHLYGALMSGNRRDNIFHVNSWNDDQDVSTLRDYLSRARHPLMRLTGEGPFEQVDPAVFVPCHEAPLHFFWPRKSLAGLPVSRHAEFARSMPVMPSEREKPHFELGNIYHLGHEEKNRVFLTHDSVCSHLCVAGAPGSGKSNFCYHVLDSLIEQGKTFLVIEPAKGEYAGVLGGREGVSCYCASPLTGQVLSINPFAFPRGISAVEHMEAVLSLLSTCWPLYAAMSAILKDAMVRIYENAGWDMDMGCSLDEEPVFPTFSDLMDVLPGMIDASEYSAEVKGNYKGALLSRVRSMTNGTNRMIFCRPEIGDEQLFNRSAIIDLSSIGSQETLALIMGVLVLRLDEFRRSEKLGTNLPLRHVTVLEEAHNLLSTSQITSPGEGASVGGKSVEMITRAIAQMRTYGEGFMIVDQTPSALSEAVNSNTSTKVIFNLPESRDRAAMGRAISLSEEQMDEVAVLERGVCILRSRGFTSPVQLKVDYFPPEKAKPWVWQPQAQDMRTARGHAVALVAGLAGDKQADLLSELLLSSRPEDRAIARAAIDGCGRDEAVGLLKRALRATDWFAFPEDGSLAAWDADMRRKLRRQAILDRAEQDAVLEWLLRLNARGPAAKTVVYKWAGNYGRFRREEI